MQQPERTSGPQDQAAGELNEAETGNAQRIPGRMLFGRRGNTEVKNGLCYILTRSQLDPRHTEPQIIDETYVDRNRLESLNFQILNPDIERRSFIKCLCTRVISLRDDWYVHLHDGTILCNMCARCFRCFTICFTAGRKLNSIDGLVLCNTCMLSYGCYRKPKLRFRLQPLPRVLDSMQDSAGANQQQQPAAPAPEPPAPRAPATRNNVEDNENRFLTRSNTSSNSSNTSPCPCPSPSPSPKPMPEALSQARFRDEGRRPLRQILYPNPRPADYGRPNYYLEAPPYLGVDRNAGIQTCPECDKQALTQALIVPAYGRVYHERSFACANCKRPMHMGYQMPGVQFESSDCPKEPKIWCTSMTCRMARVANLDQKLAPVHPGGRPKRDIPGILPRFDPAVQRELETKFLKSCTQEEVPWMEQRRLLQQQAAEENRSVKKTK